MTRPSPSSANVVPTTTERKAQAPAPSPDTVPSRSIASISSHCTKVIDDRDRDEEHAEPEEQARALDVHTRRGGDDLAPRPPAGDPQRRDGRPGRPYGREDHEAEQRAEDDEERERVDEELRERPRALRDRGAEEVGRARAESSSRRDGVAPVAPVLGPRDRLRPLRLQVRAGRPVVEGLLQLTPAPFEGDPGIGRFGGLRVARDRHDARGELAVRAARVVAADARLGRAAQPERVRVLVRVGAGRRIHDGPLVHELELLVAPGGALRALVRAVPDLDRLGGERGPRVGRVEDELDHLPVALVRVVEVVEGVEEPVLQGELARSRPRRARRRPARCPPSDAAPSGCSRSPDRARCPGSRGGTRSGRRGRPRSARSRRGR